MQLVVAQGNSGEMPDREEEDDGTDGALVLYRGDIALGDRSGNEERGVVPAVLGDVSSSMQPPDSNEPGVWSDYEDVESVVDGTRSGNCTPRAGTPAPGRSAIDSHLSTLLQQETLSDRDRFVLQSNVSHRGGRGRGFHSAPQGLGRTEDPQGHTDFGLGDTGNFFPLAGSANATPIGGAGSQEDSDVCGYFPHGPVLPNPSRHEEKVHGHFPHGPVLPNPGQNKKASGHLPQGQQLDQPQFETARKPQHDIGETVDYIVRQRNAALEADKQKAEADKQKAEADKQKAEADKQKAEADKQKAANNIEAASLKLMLDTSMTPDARNAFLAFMGKGGSSERSDFRRERSPLGSRDSRQQVEPSQRRSASPPLEPQRSSGNRGGVFLSEFPGRGRGNRSAGNPNSGAGNHRILPEFPGRGGRGDRSAGNPNSGAGNNANAGPANGAGSATGGGGASNPHPPTDRH